MTTQRHALRKDDGEMPAAGRIIRKNARQQLVTGVVYEPDVIDLQGDFANAEEIEKAAHGYMTALAARTASLRLSHRDELSGKVELVENYLAPVAFEIDGERVSKGTWIQTWHILDKNIWADIESGEITGFSMAGAGLHEDVGDRGPAAKSAPAEEGPAFNAQRVLDAVAFRDTFLAFRGAMKKTMPPSAP